MINPQIQKRSRSNLTAFLNQNFQSESIINLVSNESLEGFAEYYLYYPYLFSNAFKNIDNDQLEKLNQAGFLCFKSVVIEDKIIDNQFSEEQLPENKLNVEMLMQQALLMLKQLFSKKDSFWLKWKERQNELHNSILMDKSLSRSNFCYDKYIQFAWGKSAIAKVAIDALFIMEGEKSTKSYEALLASHREFSCAMQLFDDVIDLTEDKLNVQFNLASHLTEVQLEEKGIDYSNFNSKDFEKYTYILGIAEKILNMACDHIDKSLLIVKDINVKPWKNVLHFYTKLYKSVIQATGSYLRKIEAETFHSHFKLLKSTEIQVALGDLLETSLTKGKKFIIDHQQINGAWSEYLTSAGASNVWATGFILSTGSFLLPEDVKAKAALYLWQCANPLWGYQELYVNDTDSTNFCLLALFQCNQDIAKFEDPLLARQNDDGGFATYEEKAVPLLRKRMRMPKSTKYDGWSQSHSCVTSVTYNLLKLAYTKSAAAHIEAAETYLLNCFKQDTLSYWWTSSIYTLYYLSQGYSSITNQGLKNELVKRIESLASQQNEDGSFGDAFQKESAYYTAMMAAMLQKLNLSNNQFSQSLKKAIDWLIYNQMDDGSWKETHAMQLPEPNCVIPDNRSWPVSELGCNVRAVEFNRLFSTIISLTAIYEYKKRLRDCI